MTTETQILSNFSPRACPRCMLTCFSVGGYFFALWQKAASQQAQIRDLSIVNNQQ